MERFRKLSNFQKLLLIAQAVMVLVFSVLYAVTVRREGFAYEDGLLMRSEENGDILWSGTVGGRNAVFTVHPDRTVEYRVGDSSYGPYEVREDPSAVPKGHALSASMTGIEIYRGETRLFRGGLLHQHDEKGSISLYREDRMPEFELQISAPGAIVVHQEGEITYYKEPGPYAIAQLVYGPPLWHYGNLSFWVGGMIICLMTALAVFFWEDIFRWNLKRSFRNAEGVEPSELLSASRSLSWSAMTLAALFLFIFGLRQMA